MIKESEDLVGCGFEKNGEIQRLFSVGWDNCNKRFDIRARRARNMDGYIFTSSNLSPQFCHLCSLFFASVMARQSATSSSQKHIHHHCSLCLHPPSFSLKKDSEPPLDTAGTFPNNKHVSLSEIPHFHSSTKKGVSQVVHLFSKLTDTFPTTH